MPATPAITFASAKTVPQEITYALIWIGTNQILTTGIIVGRRRRFQIWQHGRISVNCRSDSPGSRRGFYFATRSVTAI